MKIIISLISALLISTSALASVDTETAKKELAGTYQFTDDYTGDIVEFAISTKGDVVLFENDTYYEVRSNLSSFGLGPGDLPIMTILFVGGSDEQTTSTTLRLFVERDSDEYNVKLIDAVYAENDGPNEWTFVERVEAHFKVVE